MNFIQINQLLTEKIRRRLAQKLADSLADTTGAATLQRELRALEEAGRIDPKATKRLLTLTRDAMRCDAMPEDTPKDIVTQTGYEWMLPGAVRVQASFLSR